MKPHRREGRYYNGIATACDLVVILLASLRRLASASGGPYSDFFTGTHDNNTTKGWFKKETNTADRTRLYNYTEIKANTKNAHLVLSHIAYASVAQTAILPIQDILGLDAQARINTPGDSKNNWLWRITKKTLSAEIERQLYHRTKIYNRLQLF